MKTRIALVAFAVLFGAVEPAACQSVDTSSYPKPVPQASFLDQLQQSNEIQLQQLEIQRRQMQLNEQRYLQEREQREYEARAAEAYRKRHPIEWAMPAGPPVSLSPAKLQPQQVDDLWRWARREGWRKRHAGAPATKPTKVSN